MTVRVLFIADTHLGFDLPTRPRIRRRRRGHDFLANYERALVPALEGKVDLLVHGGDVFHRARVPHTLVYQAFEPLKRLADAGVPVFVVPGNHERSRIPFPRFASHPRVHIFDTPRTVRVSARGLRIAVSGFPYQRRHVRSRFRTLVEATGWKAQDADIAILCTHHCFEGATVGPAGYTFRHAPDVIRGSDVPPGLAAVLTGHVHRHQVLTEDLSGRPLAAPVLYAGSVERTAFAEIGEPKGYILVDLQADPERSGGRLTGWTFEELPARPMILQEVQADGLGTAALARILRLAVRSAPTDAVLRLEIRGEIDDEARALLTPQRIRALAPSEMNLDVVMSAERGGRDRRRRRPVEPRGTSPLKDAARALPQ
jgi:exonuclease SbcD